MSQHVISTRAFTKAQAPEAQFVEVLEERPARVVSVSELRNAAASVYYDTFDGERSPGGLGAVPIMSFDYWTLRARSVEAYTKNLFAHGTINRIVTAIIGTGLGVESQPERAYTGMTKEQSQAWSDQVETLWRLWGSLPQMCDHLGELTLSQLERAIMLIALLSGDVLIVPTQDKRTGMPKLRIFPGERVRTPLFDHGSLPEGHRIMHGVETDKAGKVVAYYVEKISTQPWLDLRLGYERIPAFDSNGRPLAWLQFATSKRWDQVRGLPLLAMSLQSFKQLDSYRNNVQLKAALAATLALVVTRDVDAKGPGTNPLANIGAKSGFAKNVGDFTQKPPDTAGAETTLLNTLRAFPGIMVEGLAPGEDIKSFNSNAAADENLGDHEAAILSGIGFGYSVPPEVLRMTFGSNYSASRAAEVNFKVYVDQERSAFGDTLLKPLYREFLMCCALRRLVKADGMLESVGKPERWFVYAAWVHCELSGAVKPDVDPLKLVNAYSVMVAKGWITNQMVTKQLGNGRFDKNVEELARENLSLAEANKPLAPPPKEGPKPSEDDKDEEQDREETKRKLIALFEDPEVLDAMVQAIEVSNGRSEAA